MVLSLLLCWLVAGEVAVVLTDEVAAVLADITDWVNVVMGHG